MTERMRRLVPRPPQSSIALYDLGEEEGWRFLDEAEIAEEGAAGGFELEDGTVVRWFEDAVTGLGYATIHGPSEESTVELLDRELDLLQPAAYAELFEEQHTSADAGLALYAVATAAGPDHDAAAQEVLLRGMENEDPTVRRYAIVASTILGYRPLRLAIEALGREDQDPEVRATAQRTSKQLDQSRGPG